MQFLERVFGRREQGPRISEELSPMEQKAIWYIRRNYALSAAGVFSAMLQLEPVLPTSVENTMAGLENRQFIEKLHKNDLVEHIAWMKLTDRGKSALRQISNNRGRYQGTVTVQVSPIEPTLTPHQ